MASPIHKSIPKNEALVNAIQLSPKEKNEHGGYGQTAAGKAEKGKDPGVEPVVEELEFDLDRPLKHALNNVFNNGGKVLLAFPGSSYKQVSISYMHYNSKFIMCNILKLKLYTKNIKEELTNGSEEVVIKPAKNSSSQSISSKKQVRLWYYKCICHSHCTLIGSITGIAICIKSECTKG